MNIAPCGSVMMVIRTQGASKGGTITLPPSSVALAAVVGALDDQLGTGQLVLVARDLTPSLRSASPLAANSLPDCRPREGVPRDGTERFRNRGRTPPAQQ